MSEKIILEEEFLEQESYNAFSKKVTEEYDLNMSLTQAMMGYIQINDEEVRQNLELATRERIKLEAKWLHLKVKSAKARRDFEAKNNHRVNAVELEKLILPIFDKAIWEAEDELNRHIRKYGKE
ncbi:MAG: hypothetical protein AAB336_14260 [Acidobacteriota bacterium]